MRSGHLLPPRYNKTNQWCEFTSDVCNYGQRVTHNTSRVEKTKTKKSKPLIDKEREETTQSHWTSMSHMFLMYQTHHLRKSVPLIPGFLMYQDQQSSKEYIVVHHHSHSRHHISSTAPSPASSSFNLISTTIQGHHSCYSFTDNINSRNS